MARIGFFVLPNTGCLNASLKLANDLKTRGHHVCYLGLEDSEQYVRSNGFEFVPVFRQHFPKGYYAEHLKFEALPFGLDLFRALRSFKARFKVLFDDLISQGGQEFLTILKELKPDMIIFASGDPYVEWPALLAYSMRIKGIYLHDALWPYEDAGIPPIWTSLIPTNSLGSRLQIYLAWKKAKLMGAIFSKVYQLLRLDFGFEEFARRLASKCGYHCELNDTIYRRQIPRLVELVPCPADFDFPGASIPGRYHIEPSIHVDRKQVSFPWDRLAPDRPLVYCALGTVLFFAKAKYRNFFQTVVDASSIRPAWQWVLAIGELLGSSDLHSVPANIIVVNQAPQLAILERATMMITHGGTNTIKECIYFGVPMVVFPLGADHPGNTARVVYHGLGVKGELSKLNVKYLQDLIDTVDKSSYIRNQMTIMQDKFREMEDSKLGVRLIETFLGDSNLLAIRDGNSRSMASFGDRR